MSESGDSKKGDDLFEGRGSPALMSGKEPAIRMLKERFSESFALTINSNKDQVYVFLIRAGMWALVTTLTAKDYHKDSGKFTVSKALEVIEDALGGENKEMLERIEKSVLNAKNRVASKVLEFKR